MKYDMDENKREALKVSALEFTYWASMSAGSFLTVFLQSIGFTASQTGIVNGANLAVSTIAGPTWGMLSDKIQSIKRTVIICLLCAIVLQVIVPSTAALTLFGIPLIMLFMPIVSFFTQPSMYLVDNWAIQSSHKYKYSYSVVRSMGSFSWAVAGVLISYILKKTGIYVGYSYYAASLMMLPVVAIAFSTKNASVGSESDKRSLSFKELKLGSLFKNYYFSAYLIYSFILSFGLMAGFSFIPYMIRETGGSATQLGYIQGINAALQFIVLLGVKPIQRRFPVHKLLILGNALTALQYLLFGTITRSFSQMLLFTVFQGIGSALMIASSANYIFSLAPQRLKSTAQMVNSAATSVAGMCGNLIGGVLIDKIGIRGFYTTSAIWILVCVALFAMSFVFGEKVLKIAIPKIELPGISVPDKTEVEA